MAVEQLVPFWVPIVAVVPLVVGLSLRPAAMEGAYARQEFAAVDVGHNFEVAVEEVPYLEVVEGLWRWGFRLDLRRDVLRVIQTVWALQGY